MCTDVSSIAKLAEVVSTAKKRWRMATSLATQYSQGTASEPRGTVWGTCSDRAGGALRHRLGLSSSVCAPSSCGLRLPPFLSYFIYQKNPYRHDCQTIFRCGESTRFVRQISLGETLQQRAANIMKTEPKPSDRELLAGLVERVTYQNAENGFCVIRVKARGHRELITVVGHAAAISAGEWITAAGDWVNDRTHGQQFKARFLKTSAPTSVEGIEKYLASGMIRGIGPVYAKKLLRAFGEKVFDVIEAEPDRLREVDGIGPVRASRIVAAWAEQKVVREIMVFLHSHGVGTARAVRIYKTYGADAVQVMSENPYRLARDIRGIGFKTADAIAMKLGVDKTAMIRVRAGISYALTEAMDEGHCGLPSSELMPLAEKLLEVPQNLIGTALDLELADGTVIADRLGEIDCVFLASLHRAERAVAERLLTLTRGKLPWASIDPDKAIPWIERRTGLRLAESQKAAVAIALGSKVLVITGGPGVGKTTIVNAILRILAAKDVKLLLCAPTGRAAKRMNEATDRVRGQDHPPAARGRSQGRRLPAGYREPARLRSARCRRDLDG